MPVVACFVLPTSRSNAANYVSVVTVHWYKATKETPNSPSSLLDDGPVRVEMDNLRQLVQVANSFGKPLRVAEMNTISNSGRLGVSNVFAGEQVDLHELARPGRMWTNRVHDAARAVLAALLNQRCTDMHPKEALWVGRVSAEVCKQCVSAAAALWTLDGAFEVAAAGAVGVNLHQGAGQNLYSGEAGCTYTMYQAR